jgi:hypothetical protein
MAKLSLQANTHNLHLARSFSTLSLKKKISDVRSLLFMSKKFQAINAKEK